MNAVSTKPTQTSEAVRRSGRIAKEIPIVLSGGDAAGRQFSEQTRTLVLSLHGASVICHRKLIPEQEAYLRVISNNRETEVRICGQIGHRDDGYIYGVAFTDPDVDFWRVEFSPAEALPVDLIPVTLECSGCRRRVSLKFDATERDVYAVNEGMLRYCSRCSLSTIWRVASAGQMVSGGAASALSTGSDPPTSPAEGRLPVAPTLVSSLARPESPLIPAAPVAAAAAQPKGIAQPNRRRERRTQVKFDACIRASGWGEEIVPCEDASRGGFSFRSERHYSVETMIEAAVPYEPGMSIFVSAQIANVSQLKGGKLFRYGVSYIRSRNR